MEKKENMKKRYTISLMICVAIVISLIVGYVLWNKLSLKERLFRNGEIRSGEFIDDMSNREGVSFQNCIIEISYKVNENNGFRRNYLYVFSNGDIYSGDYFVEEGTLISDCHIYWSDYDERYWNCIEHPQYWGRLSEEKLEQINGYIGQTIESKDSYWKYLDSSLTEPDLQLMGEETNSQDSVGSIDGSDYKGHVYNIFYKEDGEICIFGVSYGEGDRVMECSYNTYSHEVIDAIKSTWFYEQWTNQIFGEGWEERINLYDEAELEFKFDKVYFVY